MTSRSAVPALALVTLLCDGCIASAAISGLDIGGSTMVVDTPNVPTAANTAAQIHVRLARSDGSAIAAANVTVNVPGCTATQLSNATDANGVITAAVSCASAGEFLASASLALFDANQTLAPTVPLLAYTPADGVSSIRPGTALNLEATARTASGAVNLAYTGTVHVTSTDPNAQVPDDYTFTSDDFGNKIWPAALLLYTPGAQTVTIRDVATQVVLGQQTFNVEGGQAANLVLSATNVLQAGTPFAITVHVLDSQGSAAVRYRGTVQVLSSDPNAVLPPPYTFTASDNGTTVISGAQLRTDGAQSIWLADTAQPSLQSGHTYIAVQPGPSASLRLTLPTNTFAGQPMLGDVQPIDAYGNFTTDYAGTVHFTSPDPLAQLPADANVVATDITTEHFSNIILSTSGSGSITVTDLTGVLQSGTAVSQVTPGNANQLQLVLGAACANGCAAGTPCDVTVSAIDVYGNIASGYGGTILFSSNDPRAQVPAAYTFSAADGGTRTLSNALAFVTAGSDALSVADVAATGLVASSPQIAVSPAAASQLVLSLASNVSACINLSPQVTALDPYGNTATGYGGTVHFSVTANSGTLPADYSFSGGDAGVHAFTGELQFTLPNSNTILTVADTTNPLQQSANLVVQPGPAASFFVNYGGGPLPQNTAWANTIDIRDACNNSTNTFVGLLMVTASDPNATFGNQTYNAVAGSYSNWYPGPTFQSLGDQNFTIVDTTGVLPSVTTEVDIYHTCTPYGGSMGQSGVAGVALGGNTSQSIQASLGITSSFNPVLAWADNRYGPFYTVLQEYNGSSWAAIDSSTSLGGIGGQNGNDNIVPALAIGPGDAPSVAWVATAQGGGSTSAVLYRAASGSSWVEKANSGESPGITGNASSYLDGVRLVLNSSGTPIIAWRDNSDGSVHVRTYNGSAWASFGSDPNPVGSDGEASAGALSLAVDSANKPWLAWEATVSGTSQIYVSHWTGAAWAGLGGSNSGNGLSNSSCGAQSPSLVLNGSNVPYVAYNACDTGNNEIYVQYYQAGWKGLAGSNTGTGISNNSSSSTQAAMVLNAGLPTVVWTDTSFGNPAVYLSSYNGSAWVQTNNSATRSGISNYAANDISNPQVVIGQYGVPVVAFTGNNVTYLCGWE